ncbi:hypothetical protein PM082_024898 [Marasmius tenuissimus]|nr:hypothetical protein PM082_024898 [Marasmius tenuissimus]
MSSEQQAAKQAVEAYTTVESVIVKPIAMFSVMFLVYGMYIILFGLSLNTFGAVVNPPPQKPIQDGSLPFSY